MTVAQLVQKVCNFCNFLTHRFKQSTSSYVTFIRGLWLTKWHLVTFILGFILKGLTSAQTRRLLSRINWLKPARSVNCSIVLESLRFVVVSFGLRDLKWMKCVLAFTAFKDWSEVESAEWYWSDCSKVSAWAAFMRTDALLFVKFHLLWIIDMTLKHLPQHYILMFIIFVKNVIFVIYVCKHPM